MKGWAIIPGTPTSAPQPGLTAAFRMARGLRRCADWSFLQLWHLHLPKFHQPFPAFLATNCPTISFNSDCSHYTARERMERRKLRNSILSPDEMETSSDTYNTKHSSSGNIARDQAYLHSGDVKYDRRCGFGNIKNAFFSFSPGELEETSHDMEEYMGRSLQKAKRSLRAVDSKAHSSGSFQGQCNSISVIRRY
jgi:hypothetical protein